MIEIETLKEILRIGVPCENSIYVMAADVIDRLEADLLDAKSAYSNQFQALQEVGELNRQLQAENAELRKDKERLDFIEEEWFHVNYEEKLAFNFIETWTAGKHADLRAAIDADMNRSAMAPKG